MRNRQDHREVRAYRFYVFVDDERGRGFDDEADALMHFDEEIVYAQKTANEEREIYTVSVQDELSAGKDAIVAMHICVPDPQQVFERPKFVRVSDQKKERA